jgi:hypothetical protein
MHEGDVRAALIELLRSKSRYMVKAPAPRAEALRYQMVAAVNGVIGSGSATEIRLTEFEPCRKGRATAGRAARRGRRAGRDG